MRVHKSKVFRSPGFVRWEATTPPGTSVDVFTHHSADGVHWKVSGPHRTPPGSKLEFPELGKIKLQIKLNSQRFQSPIVHKAWIYRYDQIIEFGGDAGWD